VRAAAVLVALAGCGRWGFAVPLDAVDGAEDGDAPGNGDGDLDTAAPKPDAALLPDGPAMADAPPGMGDYAVTTTTATFTPLSNATVFPGFMPKSDDESFPLALPFTFNFYRVAFTSLQVSVNGYVAFDTPATGADTTQNDCPIDATPPGAMIAAFWDDLYASENAPTATLSYQLSGAAPDRAVTIEWKDFDAFYVAGGGNNSFAQGVRVTHQIVLRETGVIELRYGPRTPPPGSNANKDCGADRHRGCSATVGLEAPASMLFKTVQCGTATGPGPGYVPIDDGKVITLSPI
jgi:hypothetical protein